MRGLSEGCAINGPVSPTFEPSRNQKGGVRNRQAYNPEAPAAHSGERCVSETERNTVRRKVVKESD
jgi:hypothetical protein